MTISQEQLHLLPPELAAGLDRYAEHGIETGGFLRSCLEFDLEMSYKRAHPSNRDRVPMIFDWIGRNMPEGSIGSPEHVNWYSQQIKLRNSYRRNGRFVEARPSEPPPRHVNCRCEQPKPKDFLEAMWEEASAIMLTLHGNRNSKP